MLGAPKWVNPVLNHSYLVRIMRNLGLMKNLAADFEPIFIEPWKNLAKKNYRLKLTVVILCRIHGIHFEFRLQVLRQGHRHTLAAKRSNFFWRSKGHRKSWKKKMAHRNRCFTMVYHGLPIKNGWIFPWKKTSESPFEFLNPSIHLSILPLTRSLRAAGILQSQTCSAPWGSVRSLNLAKAGLSHEKHQKSTRFLVFHVSSQPNSSKFYQSSWSPFQTLCPTRVSLGEVSATTSGTGA